MSDVLTTTNASQKLNPDLPVEIWAKIVLLSKLPIKQLILLATISHQFRTIILNVWFLTKYFSTQYPPLNENLVVYFNFRDATNFLKNAIPRAVGGLQTKRGYSPTNPRLPQGLVIETNEFFGHILTVNTERAVKFNHTFEKSSGHSSTNDICQISYSFWIKVNQPAKHINTIRLNPDDGCARSTLLRIDSERRIHFEYRDATLKNQQQPDVGADQKPLNEGEWNHIVLIGSYSTDLRRTSTKVYLNGEVVMNTTIRNRDESDYFCSCHMTFEFSISNVSLGEIGFWTSELSPLEVKSMAKQKTVMEKVNFAAFMLSNYGKMGSDETNEDIQVDKQESLKHKACEGTPVEKIEE